MKKEALVILAEGFEEAEAIIPMDILKRAEVSVTVAGLDSDTVKGAHNYTLKADITLKEYNSLPDAIVLPGGMPGAENLALSSMVKNLILKMNDKKKLIAAICASPALVLSPLGILEGKKATCFPGMENNFPPGAIPSKEAVVQDGNIITSRGAGTAFAFGLKITENLVGRTKADMVGKQMLYY